MCGKALRLERVQRPEVSSSGPVSTSQVLINLSRLIFPQWRILGLAIAATSFFFSNLFLQVPLSVLQVLTLKNSNVSDLEPYLLEKIEQDFTVPGVKVSKILWFLESPSEIDKTA